MADPPDLLLRPAGAGSLLVLAHGAGAGMRHPFLEGFARRLAERGAATLRYEFPYVRAGRKRPDPGAVLETAVREAVARALETADDLPLFAGGKSMGGRMTSRAAAEGGLEPLRGLVFLGFPLHPPGRSGTERAAHLERVTVPMLFLQGTRDSLAKPELLRPVCGALGELATLHMIEGADHSFRMPRTSGRSDDEVLDELADEASAWMRRLA
jgi:predicted alpha/beta-hydrolase family hydrolase